MSSLHRQASGQAKASLYLKMAYLKLREEEGLKPLDRRRRAAAAAAADGGANGGGSDGGEDALCRYCEVNGQEAVFLPCGHAGVFTYIRILS